MRAKQINVAIGLSAAVFAGLLVCVPCGLASDFSNYLAQGYGQLAKVAGKAPVSQLFKKRGTAAAHGQSLEPLQPDAKHLDVLTLNEARNYRDQLIEGLQAGGRDNQPLLAAIAQVNYDCWVMPLPKRKGAPRSAECHQRFLQAFEGLPDKHHRGPISSVEPWQFAAAAAGSAQRASSNSDAIGALILSLSSSSLPQRGAGYDAAFASTYVVGGQSTDSQILGSCDAQCLAMSFSGTGTAPLIASLTDGRERNFRGAGDPGSGQQNANAGGTDGSSGNGGSSNNGQRGNGQNNNGPGDGNSGGGVGSGGSGSGSPGNGSSGSNGPGGGDGDGGPGNGGGHGHGHHHGGG